MTPFKTRENLEFDIKHLIWHARIHRLSIRDIKTKLDTILTEYHQGAGKESQQQIDATLKRWQQELSTLLSFACPFARSCPDRSHCFDASQLQTLSSAASPPQVIIN